MVLSTWWFPTKLPTLKETDLSPLPYLTGHAVRNKCRFSNRLTFSLRLVQISALKSFFFQLYKWSHSATHYKSQEENTCNRRQINLQLCVLFGWRRTLSLNSSAHARRWPWQTGITLNHKGQETLLISRGLGFCPVWTSSVRAHESKVHSGFRENHQKKHPIPFLVTFEVLLCIIPM